MRVSEKEFFRFRIELRLFGYLENYGVTGKLQETFFVGNFKNYEIGLGRFFVNLRVFKVFEE